jgi:hypothetical protein
MMAMKQANTAQKQWMSDIANFINEVGLGLFYGEEYRGRIDFQLHHVLGRSAKHNKVDIGHWFILPVPFELHDVDSNHKLNVTHNKKAFIAIFGKQSFIFAAMFDLMSEHGYSVPSDEVYNAIMDTSA